MLGAELLQAMNQRKLKVLDDINVGLASKLSEYCRGGSADTCLDERDVWTNGVDDRQKVLR